jgi:hypothetical protein
MVELGRTAPVAIPVVDRDGRRIGKVVAPRFMGVVGHGAATVFLDRRSAGMVADSAADRYSCSR